MVVFSERREALVGSAIKRPSQSTPHGVYPSLAAPAEADPATSGKMPTRLPRGSFLAPEPFLRKRAVNARAGPRARAREQSALLSDWG
jgi:hypothetical protein